MGIIKTAKTLLVVLAIIFSGKLIAKDNDTPDYGLFLSPESCLLLDKSKQCEVSVNINWKVRQSGNYCLYNNLNDVALNCWENENHAFITILLTMEKDLTFELRQQNNNKILFKTSLKVYRKISNVRRKRRNPWSFY